MSIVRRIRVLNSPGVGRHLLKRYRLEHGITDELIEAWIEFAGTTENQLCLGDDLMWDILELVNHVSQPHYLLELKLIEANLTLMHQDTQVVWEALETALCLAPNDPRIHEFLCILNTDPDEAPCFEDGMERIAELVAEGSFPRETFDTLLETLANPTEPNLFDYPKAIAAGGY